MKIILNSLLFMFFINSPIAYSNSCHMYNNNVIKLDSGLSLLKIRESDVERVRPSILEASQGDTLSNLSDAERAVLLGDLNLVKQLYNRNKSNVELGDAAKLAALMGENEIFEWFIFETSILTNMIEARDSSNPIFDAIKSDNIEVVCMTYEKSKNLKSINRAGRSVFQHAALYGSLKSLLFVLSKGYQLTEGDRTTLPHVLKYHMMSYPEKKGE